MSKLTKKFHHRPYPTISLNRAELSTSGKTVLITGGGSGIGFACAEAFAQSGAKNIIITSRTAKTLHEKQKSLTARYPQSTVYAIVADVSKSADVAALFQTVANDIGVIDTFIANAGYAPRVQEIANMEIDDFRKGLETNLIGTYLCAQHFVRHLGRVRVVDPVFIHISTGYAHAPPQLPLSGYGVSKAAAAKLVDYLAYENPGIRVYQVHPGTVETNMTTSHNYDKNLLREVPELPGAFCVWVASREAVFLRGRFLWASWDVDELLAMKEDFEKNPALATIGLKFPNSRI